MKKILIALAILPLLIVACSSDDDVTSTTDFDHNIELLYGEWRATSVEVSGVPIDLTSSKIELLVAPTYLTFAENSKLISEGILGEGTGTYGTKDKTIYTSVGNTKVNFEMTSLNAKTAKIKLDSKLLGLALIPENTGLVTVTLTKDFDRTVDFDHDITKLYGKWRAVSLEGEGVPNTPIDLTSPFATPTYLTFAANGTLTAKGYLGEGKGRYATEDKTIFTLIEKESLQFEVETLTTTSARIQLNPDEVEFGLDIPKEVESVTLVLTKQAE